MCVVSKNVNIRWDFFFLCSLVAYRYSSDSILLKYKKIVFTNPKTQLKKCRNIAMPDVKIWIRTPASPPICVSL
jgi:hypothetical protein